VRKIPFYNHTTFLQFIRTHSKNNQKRSKMNETIWWSNVTKEKEKDKRIIRVRMYSQCYFPAWLRRIGDRVSLLRLFTMDKGTTCPKTLSCLSDERADNHRAWGCRPGNGKLWCIIWWYARLHDRMITRSDKTIRWDKTLTPHYGMWSFIQVLILPWLKL